jgi:hypothetical protein
MYCYPLACAGILSVEPVPWEPHSYTAGGKALRDGKMGMCVCVWEGSWDRALPYSHPTLPYFHPSSCFGKFPCDASNLAFLPLTYVVVFFLLQTCLFQRFYNFSVVDPNPDPDLC